MDGAYSYISERSRCKGITFDTFGFSQDMFFLSKGTHGRYQGHFGSNLPPSSQQQRSLDHRPFPTLIGECRETWRLCSQHICSYMFLRKSNILHQQHARLRSYHSIELNNSYIQHLRQLSPTQETLSFRAR